MFTSLASDHGIEIKRLVQVLAYALIPLADTSSSGIISYLIHS